MNWKIPASLLVALALVIPLFLFSPASCGCLEPVQELAMIANLDYDESNAYAYSAGDFEAGLTRAWTGRKVIAGSDWLIFYKCTAARPTEVKCRVPIDSSPLLARSFDITIATKPDGTFVDAAVRRTWALQWGKQPN